MINKILARDEEEFERFTRMDEERYLAQPEYYRSDAKGEDDDSEQANGRLMSDDEIPKWFKDTVKF